MKANLLAILLLGTWVFSGCQKPAPPPAAPAGSAPMLPTQAQGKLRTIKLWLGPEEMDAELAITQEEQMTGMMFRTNMAENAGMLFIFQRPFQAAFWMKNCPLPLSAAYIDPNGTILEIRALQPQDTNDVVAASSNVQYVLEVNQGWFQRKHIDAGTLVRTEYGSLHDTFMRR